MALNQKEKKLIIIGSISIVVLLIIAAIIFPPSPRKAVNKYLKNIASQNKKQAISYVNENKEEVLNQTNTWLEKENFEFAIKNQESWRENENDFQPCYRFLAGRFQAKTAVTIGKNTNTYLIKLQRKDTENYWDLTSYIFKNWEVYEITKVKKD